MANTKAPVKTGNYRSPDGSIKSYATGKVVTPVPVKKAAPVVSNNIASQFQAENPDTSSLYEPINMDPLRGQAADVVSGWYDDALDEALKILDTRLFQLKEDKAITDYRQLENEQRAAAVGDRQMAISLNRMQNKYAGTGMFNSGFRQGAVADLNDANAFDVQSAKINAQRTTADNNLSFSRALDALTKTKEQTIKTTNQAKTSAIESGAINLQNNELLSRQNLQNLLNNVGVPYNSQALSATNA